MGKRGSARTIVAANVGNRWFFLYGFRTDAQDSIDQLELKSLQSLASVLLGFGDRQLASAVAAGELLEVGHDFKPQETHSGRGN